MLLHNSVKIAKITHLLPIQLCEYPQNSMLVLLLRIVYVASRNSMGEITAKPTVMDILSMLTDYVSSQKFVLHIIA